MGPKSFEVRGKKGIYRHASKFLPSENAALCACSLVSKWRTHCMYPVQFFFLSVVTYFTQVHFLEQVKLESSLDQTFMVINPPYNNKYISSRLDVKH